MSNLTTHSSITGVSGAERSTAKRQVRIDAEYTGITTIEVFSPERLLTTVKVPTAELLQAVAFQAGRMLQP